MEINELQRFSSLAEKERSQYNEGLQREGYDRFFSHCPYFYIQKRTELIKEKTQFAHNKKVLERIQHTSAKNFHPAAGSHFLFFHGLRIIFEWNLSSSENNYYSKYHIPKMQHV